MSLIGETSIKNLLKKYKNQEIKESNQMKKITPKQHDLSKIEEKIEESQQSHYNKTFSNKQ